MTLHTLKDNTPPTRSFYVRLQHTKIIPYTKDLDLWVDPAGDNIERANAALEEFGSPYTLSGTNSDEILQLGVPPNRIDLLVSTGEFSFADAWARREEAPYGEAPACWIDLDTLIEIKSARSIIRDTKRTSAC